MLFTDTNPKDDPVALWDLQMKLLSKAEDLLGPRDVTKTICQPQFTDDGPRLRNTADLRGAFTELSRASEYNWHTALFEMAHETIHLLNPTVGNTNYLEEGVAVYFSLSLAPEYRAHVHNSHPKYQEALKLVKLLHVSPFEAAKLIRQRFGALSKPSAEDLGTIFVSLDSDTSTALTKTFA